MGSMVATLPRFGVTSEARLHCKTPGETQISLPTITLLDVKHDVKTWWPKGYGTQSLYILTVSHLK